jgi:hypothetical protein
MHALHAATRIFCAAARRRVRLLRLTFRVSLLLSCSTRQDSVRTEEPLGREWERVVLAEVEGRHVARSVGRGDGIDRLGDREHEPGKGVPPMAHENSLEEMQPHWRCLVSSGAANASGAVGRGAAEEASTVIEGEGGVAADASRVLEVLVWARGCGGVHERMRLALGRMESCTARVLTPQCATTGWLAQVAVAGQPREVPSEL